MMGRWRRRGMEKCYCFALTTFGIASAPAQPLPISTTLSYSRITKWKSRCLWKSVNYHVGSTIVKVLSLSGTFSNNTPSSN